MNAAAGLLVILFIIAVILDIIFISRWRIYRKLLQEHEKAGKPVSKPKLLIRAL
jgi:hypothetical protein